MEKVIKTQVIGIDVGVEKTTLAVVDLSGIVKARESFCTHDYPSVNNFVEALSERIIMLAERTGGYETIRSVGIGVPSGNFETGNIENSGNMSWKGVIPFAAMLRDRIGLAVALGNEVHAAGMGEFAYGSGHGMQNFLVVSLGHVGFGSCMFSNGLPYLGSNGFGGEVGHSCVKDGGRQCTCGRKGCLEEYVSDRGIIQTARELMEESDKPSMLRSLQTLTPETIGECWEKRDELAVETYRRTGYFLGLGLANYATVFDPEGIILIGDLSELALKWMADATQKAFDQFVFHNIRGKVKIIPSQLSAEDRSILGAAALAWQVKEYSLFL